MKTSRKNVANNDHSDLVDTLRAEWHAQSPELDTRAIDVVGRVTRLSSLWDQQINQALQPFDLSYTDFDILATLRRSGEPFELLPTQLCDCILLTSGAMTNALARLQKKSLVLRRVSKEDRRQKFVRLSAAGRKKVEEAAAVRFGIAQEQILALGRREATTLAALLKTLALDHEAKRRSD
ncbi:MAG: MarR family winged helix-turn-helix transcriptional regulator [Gammaproteobacteria bacterium]